MNQQLTKKSKMLMKEFIDKVFNQVKIDYDNVHINPIYFTDILYLTSVAIQVDDDKDKWQEIGYRICYELKTFIENYYVHENNISMLSGFGYICFSVEQYSKVTGRLKNFSNSLHKLLIEETLKKSDLLKSDYENTKSTNFDCIAGISGVLYYLLDYDCCDNELYEQAIQSSIDYLIGLTKVHEYKGKDVYNFHISYDKQFNDEDKKQFPNGNINFGMSHGMIAPLTSLAKAYSKGYKRMGIEDSINKLHKLYCDFSISIEGISYWPGQLSYEEYDSFQIDKNSIHYASSWCYGNIGVLSGLILTSINMNWQKNESIYQEELIKILDRQLEEFYLISPSLCHGFTSILAAKAPFLTKDSGQCLNSGIEENIKKIIDLCEENTREIEQDRELIENDEGRLEGYLGEYSLLSGVTGIALVFIELLYGINQYRKLLLID